MLLALLAMSSAPVPAMAEPSAAQVAFRLADDRIDEASGIAVGIASPGVVYVQNDSGDSARFFALDAHTGATLAVYSVPGATNVDWEDLAVAPDAAGVPSVWLADIGDNDADRVEIRIYRVDEPHVDPTRHGLSLATAPAEVWRLAYPSTPVDAESLAVSPIGAAYLVTKSVLGTSDVYAVPTRSDPARVQTLTRIGSIQFAPTGTPGGPYPPIGQLTATGAALSPDGSTLVVRTYTDAYLWRVPAGDVAAALRTTATRVALPAQPQGEGICIAGGSLLVDSEGVGTDVYSVPAPPLPAERVSSTSATAPITVRHPRRSNGLVAGGIAAVLVLGAVGLAIGLRGWNRRRRTRTG